MKLYELNCLISLGLSEAEQKEIQERIISHIQEKGSVVATYPLKKEMACFLITLDFQTTPEVVKEIEEKLKSEGVVQRYMILNKELARPESRTAKRKRQTINKTEKAFVSSSGREKPEEKKVELKEIEKKLEEILKE